MKTIISIFVFAIILSLSSASQLFLRDCSGNFFVYPKENGQSAIALNIQNYAVLGDMQTDAYIESVKCVCPGASTEDILKVMGSSTAGFVDFLFNQFGENPMTELVGCSFFVGSGIQAPHFVLPDSCDWEGTGECLFKYELADGIIFDVALSKCEGSYQPFVSVSCSGDSCDLLGMPCAADSECGSLSCTPVMSSGDALFSSSSNDEFEDYLRYFLLLAEEGEDRTGCSSNKMSIYSTVANYIRTAMYGQTATTFSSRVGFCSLIPLEASDSNEYFNETTNIFDCDIDQNVTHYCVSDNSVTDDPENCPKAYSCYTEYDPQTDSYVCNGNYVCAEFGYNATGDYVCIRYSCQSTKYEYNEASGIYEAVCIHSYTDAVTDAVDCHSNNGPLKSWNGIFDGVNIKTWKTNHPYTIPSHAAKTPKTQGATVLIQTTCQEEFSFFPGAKFGFTLQTQKVIDLYNMVYDLYRTRADCEADALNFEMDDTKFAANYFLPSFLAALTGTQENYFSNRVPFKTFAQYLFNSSLYSFSHVQSPSTCNYDSWKDEGKCHFTYDGFSALTGLDISFNVAIEKCSFREFPSIYLECEGKDCNMLQGLVSCDPNDDTQCPRGNCYTPEALIEDWGLNNTFVTSGCDDPDSQYLKTNMAKVLSFFEQSDSGVCLPSLSRMQSLSSSWATSEMYLEGESIVFTSAYPWEAPDSVEDSTESSESSGMYYSSIISLFLVVLGLLAA
eukprot:TRINITY_DN9325_c0_g1_i1.p1 TRINITY_DN9325_c0_g1~~TRINITY_DN9325_c0_g1_i1.p1  ORF type:complete len:729 (+),score=170.89 TRINITY_DN9325_c0_g1_i1:13-2199(+)